MWLKNANKTHILRLKALFLTAEVNFYKKSLHISHKNYTFATTYLKDIHNQDYSVVNDYETNRHIHRPQHGQTAQSVSPV